VAREVDLTVYAYQLIWRNKVDEAIEILECNLSAHPESWNVRHSLGEAYEALGDYATAATNFRLAQSLTDDAYSIAHIEQSLRRVRQFEAAAS
jgi:tetratricopeptide (TPR) repeat protein